MWGGEYHEQASCVCGMESTTSRRPVSEVESTTSRRPVCEVESTTSRRLMCGVESTTLQKHLGYFNPIYSLSELHQCDQEMLLGRFS